MKNAIVKSYVRQHRTSVPSKEASETETETAGLFLLTAIDRQWRLNKSLLNKCIGKTENRESILRELVTTKPFHSSASCVWYLCLTGLKTGFGSTWRAKIRSLPQYPQTPLRTLPNQSPRTYFQACDPFSSTVWVLQGYLKRVWEMEWRMSKTICQEPWMPSRSCMDAITSSKRICRIQSTAEISQQLTSDQITAILLKPPLFIRTLQQRCMQRSITVHNRLKPLMRDYAMHLLQSNIHVFVQNWRKKSQSRRR